MNSHFWAVLTALIVSGAACHANAYLVPVIGGVAWLLVVLAGGALVAGAFIWAHVVKIKRWMAKKESAATSDQGAATAETVADDASGDD